MIENDFVRLVFVAALDMVTSGSFDALPQDASYSSLSNDPEVIMPPSRNLTAAPDCCPGRWPLPLIAAEESVAPFGGFHGKSDARSGVYTPGYPSVAAPRLGVGLPPDAVADGRKRM